MGYGSNLVVQGGLGFGGIFLNSDSWEKQVVLDLNSYAVVVDFDSWAEKVVVNLSS